MVSVFISGDNFSCHGSALTNYIGIICLDLHRCVSITGIFSMIVSQQVKNLDKKANLVLYVSN